MTDTIDKHRRGFLTRLKKPAIEAAEKAHSIRNAPRPPYAVDELLFERLCNGCGACKSVCPNSIIEIEKGLAQINLDYNECSLCGLCLTSCSTQALHQSIPLNINLRPVISQDCHNYLQIECQQCQNSCPANAISIEEDELPTITTEKCYGCGQCARSCYMGVISMSFTSINSQ
ncbi:ferredoxin-type protein NapF [Vibrio sp. SS-MA-C1-2]|uniref:ferredoxin-type protein NapF n=1 Tax=Vibrio sp. SS-MA-C1-2 TaxID=2908646 RepID=UPI001F403185|nr:ferredoxin-type protein NapF [Vibrio sp. SS-MA-C1-2]UJF16903.1 ferredoxin-type protein NapF [Vibrio sp. SS-MA-C1-2]